ncbi:hypothetical protein CXF86_19695 [Shewanella sp. GutCb]|uniref:host specificity factor TipJ family phage tail protein n=1 Tax=Shewanella sp. GutCb TaxID=2058315 RepID=UPI000C7D68E9|nr:host specificity factor TipJ family phage tail protein [Shewanella sp. GutCb]PKG73044.1 hypothetical protein CXF86_19695 [Shewanella sp. GutCb]
MISLIVYPNKLDRSVFSSYGIEQSNSLLSTLEYYCSSLERDQFLVLVNDKPILFEDWPACRLADGDMVEVVIEPKEPITIFYAVVAVLAVGTAIYTMNNIPDTYNSTTPKGSSIYDINSQGNRVRINGAVPELLGRHKVIPDLIAPPYKTFEDNEQWLLLLMCVGGGNIDFDHPDRLNYPNDKLLYIAETEADRLGIDCQYLIAPPGADLTSHPAHQIMYTAPEVANGEVEIEVAGLVIGVASSFNKFLKPVSTNSLRLIKRELIGGLEPIEREISQQWPVTFTSGSNIEIAGSTIDNGFYSIVSVNDNRRELVLNKLDSDGIDDPTWTGFVVSGLIAFSQVNLTGSVNGKKSGPFAASKSGKSARYIWIDYKFPRGLGMLNDQGSIDNLTVTFRVEWRVISSGDPWQATTFTHTDKTLDQLGFSQRIDMQVEIRAEVRLSLVTSKLDDLKAHDDLMWVGLRSEVPSPLNYPHDTCLLMKIKASSALSAAASTQVSGIGTRVIPTMQPDGSFSTDKTRNPVNALVHLFSTSNLDYLTDLDHSRLQYLNDICASRRQYFDGVFDNQLTFIDAAKRILDVGFAMPSIEWGKLRPVRDDANRVVEQMFQPDNMMSPLRVREELVIDDEFDSVEVEYMDSKTWKSSTVLCSLAGDLGTKPKKVRAFGITERREAWRYGMRKRREYKYRRITYLFDTELDGFNCERLSCVGIADEDDFQGRIVNFDSHDNVALLSGIIEWIPGEKHYTILRAPNGSPWGPVEVYQGGSDRAFVLSSLPPFPISQGSQDDVLYRFGTLDNIETKALINTMQPAGTEKVSLVASGYDERVYADDDNEPPIA